MGFYDLDKTARTALTRRMYLQLEEDISAGTTVHLYPFFSDRDTYIRKNAYLATGQIYKKASHLRAAILTLLKRLLNDADFYVRQTVINAAGEIGMMDFGCVVSFFDRGLSDLHHSVRNAVIGSVKKMGAKNPVPVLEWAQSYLQHPDKEIRREICHGIELRGRTHPQDILPLLRQLEWDKTARVRNTLVHVLGQIAYKKGCLAIVVGDLRQWTNTALVEAALEEIIDVHERYRNFAALTREEAKAYIALPDTSNYFLSAPFNLLQ